MKKNVTPELSAKWWRGNEPDGLDGKELEKALGDFETARAKLQKDGPENNLSACLKALTQIEAAAKKLESEAQKYAKTPPKKTSASAEDFTNTADALKKYAKVTDTARKELGVQAKNAADDDDDDGDGEGLLNNAEEYKNYLKTTLRRMMKRQMNFGVGLGKQAGEHRFLFHKSKPGRALSAAIKKETNLVKLSWGIAGAHAEQPMTLVLALEGIQLPGLKKKAERLLKLNKPLPFNRVLLMVDGEEAEDVVDPEDTDTDVDADDAATDTAATPSADPEAAFKARLAALLPRIKESGSNDARLKASEAGVFARKRDYVAANRLLDELEGLLGAAVQPAAAEVTVDAMALWQSERAKVLDSLKALARTLAAAKHAGSAKAIIEVNAVMKNLTAVPASPQQVRELERYLGQDDVVHDICELDRDIRTPLLKALVQLRVQLAA